MGELTGDLYISRATEEARAERERQLAEQKRQHEESVLRQASEVSNDALLLNENKSLGSDMKKLAVNLGVYLNQRKQEGGIEEISERTQFINNCITAIAEEKHSVLESHLKEDNIRRFKGVFSKKLYSIVNPYQFYFKNRNKEVEKVTEANGLPNVLGKLINEYEQGKDAVIKRN